MAQTNQAVAQNWLESEAGWGQRPDGFSLHLTMEDCKKFRDKYWARMPKGRAPQIYSREDGDPLNVTVDAPIFNALREAHRTRRYGIWGKGSYVSAGQKLKNGKHV